MGQNKNLKKQKQNKFTVGGSRSAATTKIQVDGRGARDRSRSSNDFNKFRSYQQRRSQSHSQSRMVQLLHTGGGSRKSAITESGQTRSCAPITRYDQTKSWSPTSKTVDPVQVEVFVDLEAQMNHKKQKKCCCPVWAIIFLILLGIVLVVALIFYFTRDEENPTSSSSPTSSSTITRPSGPSRAELERREKSRLEEQELRKKEQELLEADQELCKKEQDACTKKEKDKVKKEREQLKKEQELHKKMRKIGLKKKLSSAKNVRERNLRKNSASNSNAKNVRKRRRTPPGIFISLGQSTLPLRSQRRTTRWSSITEIATVELRMLNVNVTWLRPLPPMAPLLIKVQKSWRLKMRKVYFVIKYIMRSGIVKVRKINLSAF